MTSELITRLERLSGPDREVDYLIALAIHYPTWREDDEPWSLYAGIKKPDDAETAWKQLSGDFGYHNEEPVKYYTSSIDAALSLVPEGWRWEVSNFFVDVEYTRSVSPKTGTADKCFSISDGAWALLERPIHNSKNGDWTGIREHVAGMGATPAIALCITALRAKEAGHE